jgi:hypothetical protein
MNSLIFNIFSDYAYYLSSDLFIDLMLFVFVLLRIIPVLPWGEKFFYYGLGPPYLVNNKLKCSRVITLFESLVLLFYINLLFNFVVNKFSKFFNFHTSFIAFTLFSNSNSTRSFFFFTHHKEIRNTL